MAFVLSLALCFGLSLTWFALSHPPTPLFTFQMKVTIALALAASASAFAPQLNARVPTKLMFEYGEYDDKLFDNDAKKDIYAKWDPSKPRSGMNFNPFETYKGNSPDASGVYPGEVRTSLSSVPSAPSCVCDKQPLCFAF